MTWDYSTLRLRSWKLWTFDAIHRRKYYELSEELIEYNRTDKTGILHMEITSTSQGYIHKYENLKRKTYNCNANIYFNQKYLRKNLILNYETIKILNISPAFKFTQQKASTIRIHDEIKCLRTKNNNNWINNSWIYAWFWPIHGITYGLYPTHY